MRAMGRNRHRAVLAFHQARLILQLKLAFHATPISRFLARLPVPHHHPS
jgi:hypothetical protein